MDKEAQLTPTNEVELAKALIIEVFKNLNKDHKVKRADSNLFHFIIYDVVEKTDLDLTRGWYIHGPYVPAVDDALVELGFMDKKYHQLTGTDTSMCEQLIEFEDENSLL